MKVLNLSEELKNNTYPGRGIIIGKSEDGDSVVIAYFIMGRSENSRNRIFEIDEEGIKTKAFCEEKLTDPSLIIYSPVRVINEKTIVTNGDQTDTIFDYLQKGRTFEEALRTRRFEPDAPNFTPRISGLVEKDFYKLSILKSADGEPESDYRYFFEYSNEKPGKGHFIHTYKCDGNPIPSFEGEPKLVQIKGNIDDFTNCVWESLNSDNKVSLFVRYIDIKTGKYDTRIINKNK